MVDIQQATIGRLCANYRKKINEKQQTVALETGYSIENVSAFENGRNNNAKIYNWYIKRGFCYTIIEYNEVFDDIFYGLYDVKSNDETIETIKKEMGE